VSVCACVRELRLNKSNILYTHAELPLQLILNICLINNPHCEIAFVVNHLSYILYKNADLIIHKVISHLFYALINIYISYNNSTHSPVCTDGLVAHFKL
jgi:hypothetical protein